MACENFWSKVAESAEVIRLSLSPGDKGGVGSSRNYFGIDLVCVEVHEHPRKAELTRIAEVIDYLCTHADEINAILSDD